MKIIVCVKHVPDTAATIKIAGDSGYEDSDIKFVANPYDEHGPRWPPKIPQSWPLQNPPPEDSKNLM
ncbi:MAG: hypothetical protein HOA72_13095, partial [Desulfobacula sp.]|nr:hypothetical protein [Desulfobacula sp.]MBT3485648.1 hypothetical protein [Desulfobacula sp.]MBT4200074.1 hypothetical protein [Desulfobacula sp.]MBT4507210.1 hypothetical protein [Desulfobacula sp.]MBT6749867.1 hypothetical protein [Desulfobacula sp.]